jgi:hypothetical protein
MSRAKFDDYLARKRHQHGDRFDDSALDRRFVGAFNTGARVKVTIHGETLTGTVGVSTGWRPVFLLMRTSRSLGSSAVLDASAEIVGIKHSGDRQYQCVRWDGALLIHV